MSAPGTPRRATDRGATLPVVAAMVVPLVVMVALVVDIGAKRQQEAQAQAAVDAAALAGTYSVASINPGDLDAATVMAQGKVEENFKLDHSAWATCTDPAHLPELPPGEPGECVSFDSSGANPVARVKLPPVKIGSFFGGIIGIDEMSVVSAGGADGATGPGGSSPGSTAPGSTAAATSSTATPTTTFEEGCDQRFRDNHWSDNYAAHRSQVDSMVDAALTVDNYAGGQWWDGTPDSSSPPGSPLSAPMRVPPGCEGVAGMDPVSWRRNDEWHWDDFWHNSCLDWFLNDRGSVPDGVCAFSDQQPPTGSGTSTSIPATSSPGSGGPTTSGDITLG